MLYNLLRRKYTECEKEIKSLETEDSDMHTIFRVQHKENSKITLLSHVHMHTHTHRDTYTQIYAKPSSLILRSQNFNNTPQISIY